MKDNSLIQSEIWHYPGNTPEAFFVQTEYTHHHFQPHFHTHYVFFGVKHGVNEGSFSRKKYRITPDDFLIIHPGEIHSGNSFSNGSLKYHTFCPTEKFLTTVAESMELTSLPSFPSIIPDAGTIIRKFNSLMKRSAAQGDHSFLEQSVIDFLGTLIENTCRNTIHDARNIYKEKINRAKKFIEDNYTNDFSLAELGRYAGLSSYHLLRSFKNYVGLTPHAYLYNFRAEMAKRKMNGNVSLTHLAHHSGFYDQSHFIRHFKKINGIAPSGFKK